MKNEGRKNEPSSTRHRPHPGDEFGSVRPPRAPAWLSHLARWYMYTVQWRSGRQRAAAGRGGKHRSAAPIRLSASPTRVLASFVSFLPRSQRHGTRRIYASTPLLRRS
jgi:hypothetical protein